MMSNRRFLTVNEAVLEYRLSRSTIYKLRKENKIKWFNPTGRKVLILRKSIDGYFESVSSQMEQEYFINNKNL